MAEEKKKSFPKIPRANWFSLRERFRQRPPSEITVSYLASALSINEPSAANLLAPLKALGLVGSNNKLTDLAFEWRDDATYPAACEKMLEATYPAELRDLYHDSSASLRDVANWISNYLRIGESASTTMASLYLLLLEADPTKKESTPKAKPSSLGTKVTRAVKPVKTATKAAAKPAVAVAGNQGQDDAGEEEKSNGRGFSPKLHVDIQIHISPDSTPEQIDKIFESMAKHLPLKG